MVKVFCSQPFVLGLRPSSVAVVMHYWWFPSGMKQQYSASTSCNGELDVDTVTNNSSLIEMETTRYIFASIFIYMLPNSDCESEARPKRLLSNLILS